MERSPGTQGEVAAPAATATEPELADVPVVAWGVAAAEAGSASVAPPGVAGAVDEGEDEEVGDLGADLTGAPLPGTEAEGAGAGSDGEGSDSELELPLERRPTKKTMQATRASTAIPPTTAMAAG
jgi:hypothetical protein